MGFRQERLYPVSLAYDVVFAIERTSKTLLFLAGRMTLQLPDSTARWLSLKSKSRFHLVHQLLKRQRSRAVVA
jgi:hypothetical protein